MRYIILSDIHSNLEALLAVFEDIESLEYDRVICLGDIVGYGANPNECCELLFSFEPLCILGNHDYASFNLNESLYFNLSASIAARWTYKTLKPAYKEILQSFKDIEQVDSQFYMVHGGLIDRNMYIMGLEAAKENIEYLKENNSVKICFYGHTHEKRIWCKSPEGDISTSPINYSEGEGGSDNFVLDLDKDSYYLINPGSVGQPRDRDNRASYIFFDTNKLSIEYRLVKYDIATAQKKIYKAGLPSNLGDRLLYGI